jgi:LmbE family N-acetylglucosaminyl deacetylase
MTEPREGIEMDLNDEWRAHRRAPWPSGRFVALMLASLLGLPVLASARSVDLAASADFVAPLAESANDWRWPELPESCQRPPGCTLLGEISISSRHSRPEITVEAGDLAVRQAFAPRAQGTRFLNLSAFANLPAGTPLVLKLERLRSPGPTRLLAYANPDLAEARVLVLAPHPDDAEIAAFGLYANTAADVVTVTAGDAGGFNYRTLFADPAEHYEIKGRIRTWDSITVPMLGGVPPGPARNLGYSDATLAQLWRQRPEPVAAPLAAIEDPSEFRRLNVQPELRDRPLRPTWDGLVSDLVLELRTVQPDFVAAPHPFLDGHPDHQFTTIALLTAMEQLATSGSAAAPTLLLYTNHMVGAEPWPFGPREAVVGPPPFDALAAPEALEFDAVFSWPLDEQDRALKILALEMMHDLRPLDLRDPKGAGQEWKEAWRATRRSWRRTETPSYNYLRRAPRPNELFFVLGADRAAELRTRFLRLVEQRLAGAAE